MNCPACNKAIDQTRVNKRYCNGTCRTRFRRSLRNGHRYVDGKLEIPAGTKDHTGWLTDDGGEPDMIAVHLAVSGSRVPELTFREAVIAGSQLIEQARTVTATNVVLNYGLKGHSAAELIQLRLGCSPRQAKNLMAVVRSWKREGQL